MTILTLAPIIKRWLKKTSNTKWYVEDNHIYMFGFDHNRYDFRPGHHIQLTICESYVQTSAVWDMTIDAANPLFFSKLGKLLSFLQSHEKRQGQVIDKFINDERSLLLRTLGK
jgi:hypothetical protein